MMCLIQHVPHCSSTCIFQSLHTFVKGSARTPFTVIATKSSTFLFNFSIFCSLNSCLHRLQQSLRLQSIIQHSFRFVHCKCVVCRDCCKCHSKVILFKCLDEKLNTTSAYCKDQNSLLYCPEAILVHWHRQRKLGRVQHFEGRQLYESSIIRQAWYWTPNGTNLDRRKVRTTTHCALLDVHIRNWCTAK